MPIHEFECRNGHRTERFFKTFGEVDELENYCYEHPETGEILQEGKYIACPACHEMATMQISRPCEAMLFGNPDGYHKPSPLKRYNTKLVSSKEGNSSAIG